MTDERAEIARAACALDETLAGPERFGKRRVDRMYADMNKLRAAIRAEGTDAIQDAWDRVEECIDFAYRGCPVCRATHGPSQDMAGDERVRRLIQEAYRTADAIDWAYGDPHDEETPHHYSAGLRAALSAMDTPAQGGGDE